jgi:hypothetical protein
MKRTHMWAAGGGRAGGRGGGRAERGGQEIQLVYFNPKSIN